MPTQHPESTSIGHEVQRTPVPQQDDEHELVVVKPDPFNAEAPIAALHGQETPVDLFYVRNHFDVPAITLSEWQLTVAGAVDQPFTLSFDDLRALPTQTISATIECAGNNRIGFAPLPLGEPWGAGAISTATWQGVPLLHVLERAGVQPSAVEILFSGADGDTTLAPGSKQSFDRSLPRAKAFDPTILLAFAMNGAPLTPDHGGPVRLIVPDWYGVASVKWLARIEALTQPFGGYFQRERYVFEYPGKAEVEPLTTMRVKSIITSPAPGTILAPGRHTISGVAWSGDGAIAQVEVSTAGEGTWHPARLIGPPVPHTWQQWEWDWEAPKAGRYVLRVRATDTAGHVQPDSATWNRHGYANNAIQTMIVDIRA